LDCIYIYRAASLSASRFTPDAKGGDVTETLYAIIEHGERKKVKIQDSSYGVDFFTMRNGFQWSGFRVDDEILSMMQEAIEQYFKIIDK
jgi:hypothetical protein